MGEYIKKSDKENLRLLNWDLSNLYYYIDFLKKSQDHYMNRKRLYNWTYSFRMQQLDEIKAKIPEVYQHINEVKTSIAEIKARMNKNKQPDSHYERRYNNEYNDLYNDEYSFINETNYDDYEYEYEEEVNECNTLGNTNKYLYGGGNPDDDDYRFNPATGTFE
jgi:chromosome segregation ATPase